MRQRAIRTGRARRDLIAQALDIHQRHYGPDHALTGRVLFDLGLATSDPDLKLERLRRAIAIREASDQPDDLLLATAPGDLALVLSSRGEEAEAIATGQRALTRHQAQARRAAPDFDSCCMNQPGRHSIETTVASRRRWDFTGVSTNWSGPLPRNAIATGLPAVRHGSEPDGLGDPESAEPKPAPGHRYSGCQRRPVAPATTHARLGDCLRLQSGLDEAKTQYEQSLTILEAIGRDDADATVQEVRAGADRTEHPELIPMKGSSEFSR